MHPSKPDPIWDNDPWTDYSSGSGEKSSKDSERWPPIAEALAAQELKSDGSRHSDGARQAEVPHQLSLDAECGTSNDERVSQERIEALAADRLECIRPLLVQLLNAHLNGHPLAPIMDEVVRRNVAAHPCSDTAGSMISEMNGSQLRRKQRRSKRAATRGASTCSQPCHSLASSDAQSSGLCNIEHIHSQLEAALSRIGALEASLANGTLGVQ